MVEVNVLPTPFTPKWIYTKGADYITQVYYNDTLNRWFIEYSQHTIYDSEYTGFESLVAVFKSVCTTYFANKI